MNADDDAERDARLLEALRHAPDADTAPPPALSRAILQAAHEAVPAAPPSLAQRLREAWSWLARPPVAAGFASVMLASVVGLMWWDRPIEEGLRAPEPQIAQAPAASAAAAIVTVTAAPAPALTEPAAAAQTPEPDAKRDAARGRPKTTATERARPVEEKARRAPPPRAAERSAEVMAAAPATPGPVAPPAARMAPAPARSEAVADDARAAAAAPAAPAAEAEAALGKVQALPSRAAGAAALVAAPSPLASLRGALGAEPQAFEWQRGDAPAQPVNDALQTWLALADAAPATPWQRAGASPEPPTLRVLRDGRTVAALSIRGDRLHLDTEGRSWQAGLAPGRGAALLASAP